MSYRNFVWAQVERWSSVAFLVAAGLFVLPTAVFGLRAATGTGSVMSPVIIFGLLLVVFVGLLGLYPGLAERDSILVRCGVGTLGATAAIIIAFLGISVVPAGLTVEKSTILVLVMSVLVGSILTVTSFGLASLQTRAHSRVVGGSLLVLAAGEAFLIAATLFFGDPTPAWVAFVVNGLFATSLGAIGFALRTEYHPVEDPERTDDVSTS